MGRGTAITLIVLGATLAAPTAAAPFHRALNTHDLEFDYQWPTEAAAIPALDQRFHAEMDKALKGARANARDDVKLAREQKRQFNQHYYSRKWTAVGQSPRLLSLESETSLFEGGAHPNTEYNALLWDRRENRPVSVSALFTRPGDLAAVTRAAYCKSLDAERAKRREGMKLDLAEFNECPKYSDLAVAPFDKDKNGKFDALRFVASPYVAGPYVEGEYVITLPVTLKRTAALKAEYRGSFELYRQ